MFENWRCVRQRGVLGRRQAIFSQESWRISRKNCAVQGAKDPLIGHVDIFQTSPKAKIYPAKKLQEKYEGCADQSILYIGKAEGKRGLRQRLKQYMDYGRGNGNIHAGGRAVWQISDCGLLLLAYEACENPGERERQLLQEYREKNGSYPLANWRG